MAAPSACPDNNAREFQMIRTLSILALTATMISAASAQQYVYPAKGQSPEQQKSDEAACHT
jgi:hypothetical protein